MIFVIALKNGISGEKPFYISFVCKEKQPHCKNRLNLGREMTFL